MANLLWNASLAYVERACAKPQALAQWYARILGDAVTPLATGGFVVHGHERVLLISPGAPKSAPSIGYAFPNSIQFNRFRKALAEAGVSELSTSRHVLEILPTNETFSIADPDGRSLTFFIRTEKAPTATNTDALPARLQHFVCASTQTPAMLAFYRDVLQFVESDRVVDDVGELTAAFVRSDFEHHSFAVFRAPQSGPDHHAYELPDWNAIRDWADRCGALTIPVWWGPGRHGVGNNLFFMIEDPEGYKVEFSAELEHMTELQEYRTWPHGERALNLWGNAWMRS
jgi:catechol 2,3-dioxygenase